MAVIFESLKNKQWQLRGPAHLPESLGCGHSLSRSLAAGWVFQIKGEIDDSHLKVRRAAVYSELRAMCSPANPTWAHLGIKILPLNAQVSINHIKAHQQAPHHHSLLFHHQRPGLIKFTGRQTETIVICAGAAHPVGYSSSLTSAGLCGPAKLSYNLQLSFAWVLNGAKLFLSPGPSWELKQNKSKSWDPLIEAN